MNVWRRDNEGSVAGNLATIDRTCNVLAMQKTCWAFGRSVGARCKQDPTKCRILIIHKLILVRKGKKRQRFKIDLHQCCSDRTAVVDIRSVRYFGGARSSLTWSNWKEVGAPPSKEIALSSTTLETLFVSKSTHVYFSTKARAPSHVTLDVIFSWKLLLAINKRKAKLNQYNPFTTTTWRAISH